MVAVLVMAIKVVPRCTVIIIGDKLFLQCLVLFELFLAVLELLVDVVLSGVQNSREIGQLITEKMRL